MRRANPPVPSSLAILKAKQVAEQLSILQEVFKASWQWFSGLQQLLHGEGVEVDRDNSNLQAALDELCAIIAQYDPKNVYNMDETGLYFRLLPGYTLLSPFEDVSSKRSKKKLKNEYYL